MRSTSLERFFLNPKLNIYPPDDDWIATSRNMVIVTAIALSWGADPFSPLQNVWSWFVNNESRLLRSDVRANLPHSEEHPAQNYIVQIELRNFK